MAPEDRGHRGIWEEVSYYDNSVFFPAEKHQPSCLVTMPLGPRATATIAMKTQTHLAFLAAEIAGKHLFPIGFHHRGNMAWEMVLGGLGSLAWESQ